MTRFQAIVPRQHHIELRAAPWNDELRDDHILVRTRKTFISAGTELAIWSGADPRTRDPKSWCAYPFYPGYANAGVVEKIGSKVENFAPGDRVLSVAAHVSHFHFPAKENAFIARIPDGVSDEEAAASRMAQIALTALEESRNAGLARWVGVWGLGPVGNLAAQFFQIAGARVVGIDPSIARRELAQKCGLEHVLGGEKAEIAAQIQDLTGGAGLSTAIDAVGHPAVGLACIENTARFGEVLILGSPRASVEGDLRDVFAPAFQKSLTIRGLHEMAVPARHNHERHGSSLKRHETLMAWIGGGRLQIAPLVSHTMPVAQIAAAYDGLATRPDEFWGVVLDWSST